MVIPRILWVCIQVNLSTPVPKLGGKGNPLICKNLLYVHFFVDSQRAMTRNDIDLVAVSIGNSWKRMARNMGLSDGNIDAINHDYDRDGLYEKVGFSALPINRNIYLQVL